MPKGNSRGKGPDGERAPENAAPAPSAQIRYSTKRARAYTRSVDYDEVRRRVKRGERKVDIALALGISRKLVYHIMRGDQSVSAPVFVPKVSRCPRCGGRKAKASEMCRACRHASRLPKWRAIKHHRIPRIELGGVGFGRVVKWNGRFAVVEPRGKSKAKVKTLHFWDGPPEHVADSEIVEQLAYTEWVDD